MKDDCPSPSPLSNHASLFPPPPPPSSFSTTENIARVKPFTYTKTKTKETSQLLYSTSSQIFHHQIISLQHHLLIHGQFQ